MDDAPLQAGRIAAVGDGAREVVSALEKTLVEHELQYSDPLELWDDDGGPARILVVGAGAATEWWFTEEEWGRELRLPEGAALLPIVLGTPTLDELPPSVSSIPAVVVDDWPDHLEPLQALVDDFAREPRPRTFHGRMPHPAGVVVVEDLGSMVSGFGAYLSDGSVVAAAERFGDYPVIAVRDPDARGPAVHAERVGPPVVGRRRTTVFRPVEQLVASPIEPTPGPVPPGTPVSVLVPGEHLTAAFPARTAATGGTRTMLLEGLNPSEFLYGAPVVVDGLLAGIVTDVNQDAGTVIASHTVGLTGSDEADEQRRLEDEPAEADEQTDEELAETATGADEQDERGEASADDAATADAATAPAVSSGRTPLVHDQPATVDLLGRKALADEISALVEELAAADDRPEAFAIHLDAPWGAGKSSLINFVAANLGRTQPPWLVVRLDAWRSSQLSPAWWALLTHVQDGVRSSLGWWSRRWFDLRRFTREIGQLWRYWLPVVLVLVGLAIADIWFSTFNVFDSIPAIAGVVGAAGTLAAVGTRFLSLGTLQGARLHQRLNDNPMREVAERLRWLRARTERPMLLVVDDIDRCNERFAVELLDAIQTLMRSPIESGRERKLQALVVIGVGDHRWLQAAYDHTYSVFADRVSEPGRPLGRLFLDKLFQLHIDLPKLNAGQMRGYLSHLLTHDESRAAAPEDQSAVDGLKREVQQVLATAGPAGSTLDDQLAEVAQRAFTVLPEKAAEDVIGYALSERRRDPGRAVRERHLLEDYAELLQPNPRSAKRFLMAYNINYTARVAEGSDVDSRTLALWTLLSTRWPALAAWIGDELPNGSLLPLDDAAHPSRLLLDDEVRAVLGSDRGGPLTREMVLRCTGRRPEPSPDRAATTPAAAG